MFNGSGGGITGIVPTLEPGDDDRGDEFGPTTRLEIAHVPHGHGYQRNYAVLEGVGSTGPRAVVRHPVGAVPSVTSSFGACETAGNRRVARRMLDAMPRRP